jgi:hypothetical protein
LTSSRSFVLRLMRFISFLLRPGSADGLTTLEPRRLEDDA